jgi:hypothetical protein
MGKNYMNLNLSLFPHVFCLVTFFRMFFKAQIKNQHKILLFLHPIFILLRKKLWGHISTIFQTSNAYAKKPNIFNVFVANSKYLKVVSNGTGGGV